jgi:hypothetical protein
VYFLFFYVVLLYDNKKLIIDGETAITNVNQQTAPTIFKINTYGMMIYYGGKESKTTNFYSYLSISRVNIIRKRKETYF